MRKYETYVHIGLPKAASTTLQKHFFAKHEMLSNIGVYPVKNIGGDTACVLSEVAFLKDPRIKSFYSHLVSDDEVEFDYQGCSNLLATLLEDYSFEGSGKVVFSDEKLTSTFYSHPDIGLKALRLQKIMPQAKIIIILREQVSWIASQYRDHPFDPRHLDIGRPVSVEKWIDIALWSPGIKLFSMLEYNELVKLYENLFGAENVCVLLFEEFINEMPQFANKLSCFMGVDYEQALCLLQDKHENTGVSASFNMYRSIKRRCLPPGMLEKIYNSRFKQVVEAVVRRGNKQNIEISPQYINKLGLMFSEGNALLNVRHELGMEKYSYRLKGESST